MFQTKTLSICAFILMMTPSLFAEGTHNQWMPVNQDEEMMLTSDDYEMQGSDSIRTGYCSFEDGKIIRINDDHSKREVFVTRILGQGSQNYQVNCTSDASIVKAWHEYVADSQAAHGAWRQGLHP